MTLNICFVKMLYSLIIFTKCTMHYVLLTTRYSDSDKTPTVAKTVPSRVTVASEQVFNSIPNINGIYKYN